jgi:hypothetical protein
MMDFRRASLRSLYNWFISAEELKRGNVWSTLKTDNKAPVY